MTTQYRKNRLAAQGITVTDLPKRMTNKQKIDILTSALWECLDWFEEAPIDELEAVEDAIGCNAPTKTISDALRKLALDKLTD